MRLARRQFVAAAFSAGIGCRGSDNAEPSSEWRRQSEMIVDVLKKTSDVALIQFNKGPLVCLWHIDPTRFTAWILDAARDRIDIPYAFLNDAGFWRDGDHLVCEFPAVFDRKMALAIDRLLVAVSFLAAIEVLTYSVIHLE
jgi:hypothetical protein